MRKGFLVAGSFVLLFLFAGGMVVLLGAQDGNIEQPSPATGPGGESKGSLNEGPSGTHPGTRSGAPILNPGLSNQPPFTLEQVIETPSGFLYALSKEKGFLVSFDEGTSWLERNAGLPRRVVYPFDERSQRVRHLTALNIDPLSEQRIAVTTADELYISEDYGTSWQLIPLDKPLRSTSYLTAVALSPLDRDTLLVGTSFNGFFETRDRGSSWQDPSLSARFLYRGAGFYEEISAVSYHPTEPGIIFFACGFGHGIYEGSPDRKSWNRLDFPGDENNEVVRRLETARSGDSWLLRVQTPQSSWHYALNQGSWRPAGAQGGGPAVAAFPENNPLADPFRRERVRKASDRFGIYVSSYRARGEDLDNNLRLIRENGLNALVVDCKDDFGWIAYDTELEFPRKIGAVNQRFSLEELLDKAHEQGVYVIARLVVFKDKRLYNYNNYQYAVWNGINEQPWRYLKKEEVPPDPEAVETENGNGESGEEKPQPVYRYIQNEFWVDPYNSFVWDYNLAIAAELQERGVDEIQFDYIRFPSDGDLTQIRYRYRQDGMSPIDALESFLTRARESIHIPISTDLYGFNSWHRMGNWIGQSIEVLADYVDAICPMFYPSHFPRDFMKDEPYLERARKIYSEGTSRASFMVAGHSIIRPYIQAFLIGEELAMDSSRYSLYLTEQVEGTLEAPSSGFTLWNASNRYYMVTAPLTPYIVRGNTSSEAGGKE